MKAMLQFVSILLTREKIVGSTIPQRKILRHNKGSNINLNSNLLTTYASLEPSLHQSLTPSMSTLIPTFIPTFIPTIILFNPRDYSPTPTVEPTTTSQPTLLTTSTATTSNTFANSISNTAASTYSTSTLVTLPNTLSTSTGTTTITLSTVPTSSFTSAPSYDASVSPTLLQSLSPSSQQISNPSSPPSTEPTLSFSLSPSIEPSTQPSKLPSIFPTKYPSQKPSNMPTTMPSHNPSAKPTRHPTKSPSILPTYTPSSAPSINPSITPSITPSVIPTINPSVAPSAIPTINPSVIPSAAPTFNPSLIPSTCPSCAPSIFPSCTPSFRPSLMPTSSPSASPTFQIQINQDNNRSSLNALSQPAYIGIIIVCGMLVCFACAYCIYRKFYSNGKKKDEREKYSQVSQSSTKGFWSTNSNSIEKDTSSKGMMPPTVPNETYENDMYGRHRASTISRVSVVNAEFDRNTNTFGTELSNERQSYFMRSSMFNASRPNTISKIEINRNYVSSDIAIRGRISRGSSVDSIDSRPNVSLNEQARVANRCDITPGYSMDSGEDRRVSIVAHGRTRRGNSVDSLDSRPRRSSSNGLSLMESHQLNLIANNPLSRSTGRSRTNSQVSLAGKEDVYRRKRRCSSDAHKLAQTSNIHCVGREHLHDEMIGVSPYSTHSDTLSATDSFSSAGYSPESNYSNSSCLAIEALSSEKGGNVGIVVTSEDISPIQDQIKNAQSPKRGSTNYGYPQTLIEDLKHQLVSRNNIIESIRKTPSTATGEVNEQLALSASASSSMRFAGAAKVMFQQGNDTQVQLPSQNILSNLSNGDSYLERQGELQPRQESSSIHSFNSDFDPFAIDRLSSNSSNNVIEFQTLHDKNRDKILLCNLQGARASDSEGGSVNRDSFMINQFAYDTESDMDTSTDRGSTFN